MTPGEIRIKLPFMEGPMEEEEKLASEIVTNAQQRWFMIEASIQDCINSTPAPN